MGKGTCRKGCNGGLKFKIPVNHCSRMGLQAPWQSLAFVEMPTLERSGERQAVLRPAGATPDPHPVHHLWGNKRGEIFPGKRKAWLHGSKSGCLPARLAILRGRHIKIGVVGDAGTEMVVMSEGSGSYPFIQVLLHHLISADSWCSVSESKMVRHIFKNSRLKANSLIFSTEEERLQRGNLRVRSL